MKALQEVGVKTTAFVRDAHNNTIKAFNQGNIEMLTQPADFSEIIPKASLVIHSGGGGTSTACLMTGRPQITFPTHSETGLNSKLMKEHGCAVPVSNQIELEPLVKLLKKVINESRLKSNATKVAQQLAKGSWKNALDTITEHAEQLMDKNRSV